jgi:hypothetical protein
LLFCQDTRCALSSSPLPVVTVEKGKGELPGKGSAMVFVAEL